MNSHDVAGLEELGWNDDFARALLDIGDPTLDPARVTADFGTLFAKSSRCSVCLDPRFTLNGSSLQNARLGLGEATRQAFGRC